MVNLVAAQKPLMRGLMKMAGVEPHKVEIEAGTVMNFWVPSETLKKPKNQTPQDQNNKDKKKKKTKPIKPTLVLIHGFAAEGIVTWQFQVGALTKKYSVYIPDLLFFGESISDSTNRSPVFQAESLATGLKKLGIERCSVVGFSYGGMVAFKLAELYPDLVHGLVISGSILNMTDSISETNLQRLGFSSSSELLLPTSVKGLKTLLRVATYKKLWFPDCLHKDYLEVMFTNRKDRSELLEALVISNKDVSIPSFPQKIHLLWGENDQIFKLELAQNMKEQLGSNTTIQGIKKAGHLVHLERPCVYNRCLKQFLASLYEDGSAK
ncbi:Alpha/beta hydrolase fold-1 [Dillenia turbinata]|uniref:Alpha/beta hydrolase fold-1 n=1 Tax=Dillenia turbinata TaxID=194707 RepID=A0AAN8V0M8_9MAGN